MQRVDLTSKVIAQVLFSADKFSGTAKKLLPVVQQGRLKKKLCEAVVNSV